MVDWCALFCENGEPGRACCPGLFFCVNTGIMGILLEVFFHFLKDMEGDLVEVNAGEKK